MSVRFVRSAAAYRMRRPRAVRMVALVGWAAVGVGEQSEPMRKPLLPQERYYARASGRVTCNHEAREFALKMGETC